MLKRASKAQLLEKLYLEILDDVSNNDGESLSDSGTANFRIDEYEVKLKIEFKGAVLRLVTSDD